MSAQTDRSTLPVETFRRAFLAGQPRESPGTLTPVAAIVVFALGFHPHARKCQPQSPHLIRLRSKKGWRVLRLHMIRFALSTYERHGRSVPTRSEARRVQSAYGSDSWYVCRRRVRPYTCGSRSCCERGKDASFRLHAYAHYEVLYATKQMIRYP